MRQYNSFLVRVWSSESGECRIELEHVQSGKHARLSSLLMAMVWLASYTGVAADTGGSTPAAHSRGIAAGS